MADSRNLADQLGTIVKNDLTTVTNQLTGLNGVHEQEADADNPDEQNKLALLKLALSPLKAVIGASMMFGGALMFFFPKKKLEIVQHGVASVSEDGVNPAGDDQFETGEIRLTGEYASGSLTMRQKTEAKTYAGEPIENPEHNGDMQINPMPRLPTSPTPVIDFSSRRTPVVITTTTTSVPAAQIIKTGGSEVIESVYDLLSGVSVASIAAARAAHGLYKSATPATPAPAQPHQERKAGPSNS